MREQRASQEGFCAPTARHAGAGTKSVWPDLAFYLARNRCRSQSDVLRFREVGVGAAMRPQQFSCSIAGRSVSIVLRSGQGLLEDGVPYVWCAERDCQHVDRNAPPCPLSTTMFEDPRHAAAVVTRLSSNPRDQVCYACLSDELGMPHESLRRAAWRLRDDLGAVIVVRRCTSCRRRALTISLRNATLPPAAPSAGAPVPTAVTRLDDEQIATQRVVRALARTGDHALCAACLAFASELSLADARCIVGDLHLQEIALIREGVCEGCGRDETVATLKARG